MISNRRILLDREVTTDMWKDNIEHSGVSINEALSRTIGDYLEISMSNKLEKAVQSYYRICAGYTGFFFKDRGT